MNQEDIERRIREIFGADSSRLSHTQTTKEIDNPAFVPPGTPGFNPTILPKLSVTEEIWTDASGNKYTIQRWPDDTNHEIGTTTAPAKPGTSSADESVSAPPNQPNIVTRKPDGTVVTTPNPNYRPDPVAASNERNEAELNRERQWNSEHGYGWVTHAQRETAVRQEEAQARADRNEARQTAATEAANQLARDRFQFDKDKANLPDVKVEPVDRNGQRYTTVTSVPKDGKPATIRTYGPDGKPVDRLPSEGESSTGGPPMPTIVLGAIEQSMRDYHTRLWADPRLTPAQREKRFAEFVQVATLAQNQANTLQRERESQRNADYNTATTKLNYLENSTDAALKFVLDLNGKVDPGSGLGGQAFAALMGLQMLNLKASGIDSIKPAGSSVPAAGQLNLSDPKALTQQQQAIGSQLATVAAQAATPPPAAPTAPAPTGGPAEPPARSNIPPQPTTATPTNPNGVTTPGAPPAAITAEQAAAYEAGGVNPATGDISVQATPQPSIPEASPIPSDQAPLKQDVPDYGQPGMRVLPDPNLGQPGDPTMGPAVPSQYGAGEDMPKISAATFPALASLIPPPASIAPPNPALAQSPAMIQAQAQAVNPFTLTEDEYNRLIQAGANPDDIWSVPGRRVA